MSFDKIAYRKKYYREHREDIRNKKNAWYAANRKKAIAYNTARNQTSEGRNRRNELARLRYKKNPVKSKEWRINNPEKAAANARIYVQRRQCRLQNAPGFFSNTNWRLKVD